MDTGAAHASDGALMVRYQRGDLSAYQELVRRHLAGVYTVSYFRVGAESAASELTQAIFAEMARRAGEFREQTAFVTWLYRLAVGVSAPGLHDLDTASATEPSSDPSDESLRLVRSLSEAQRTVLILKHVAGLEFRQIAEIVGLDSSTVKDRMRKALGLVQKASLERRASLDDLLRPKTRGKGGEPRGL